MVAIPRPAPPIRSPLAIAVPPERMSDPLSDKDKDLLALAAELHRPLARAAKRAYDNGGWLALFGGLTALFGILGPDVVGLIVGGCVLGVGILERRNGERLRRADVEAPRLLARNELCLMVVIVIYALLQLTVFRTTGEELERAAGGALGGLDIKGMASSLTNPVYATVIAVTLLYQGGMALYYRKRRADVERFVGEIPEWARDLIVNMAV